MEKLERKKESDGKKVTEWTQAFGKEGKKRRKKEKEMRKRGRGK